MTHCVHPSSTLRFGDQPIMVLGHGSQQRTCTCSNTLSGALCSPPRFGDQPIMVLGYDLLSADRLVLDLANNRIYVK